MPLWLFLTVLAAELVACFVIGVVMMCLSGRIWRARRLTFRRALISQALLLPVGLAPYLVEVQRLPLTALLAATLVSIGITLAVVRVAAGTGWLRALGIWALSTAMAMVTGVALVVVQKRTIIENFRLPTAGMSPTLIPDDRFFVDRLATPVRWDVIVFRSPEHPDTFYTMRVVGLPGETVEIVKGTIQINGATITKPTAVAGISYIGDRQVDSWCHACTGSPMTLGPDEYLVLGDNTEQSRDSRYWGPPADGKSQPGALPRHAIVGVVRVVYAPASRIGIVR